jgi:hypothetical protein
MDLERFKTFIEERGRETRGWRGEIHDGVPESESSMQDASWATGTTAGSTMAPGAMTPDETIAYDSVPRSDATGDDLPSSSDRI